MNPTVLINTAPSVTPYESIDMTNKAEITELEPNDLDVKLIGPYGDERRHRRSIKRQLRINVAGLSNDQAYKLREWKHDRKLLRLNGNYNQHTKLFHDFRSADRSDFSPGVQIGPEPTFDRVTSNSAVLATFEHDNGFLYPVENDVPRYQSGQHSKGILIESSANQYHGKSHPASGDLIFTLNDISGTAVYTWNSTYQSIYNEESGVGYFIGNSGDYLEKSLSSAGSPASHSAFIYLKGEGTASFYISGVSGGPIETGHYTLNPHIWTKFSLENFVKTGTLFFRVYSRAAASQILVGPWQLEGNPACTSYIHNLTGTAHKRDHDKLYYPIRVNAMGGMVHVGFTAHTTWPASPATKQYLYHIGTAPSDFFLAYDSALGEYYFQKKNAATNVSAAMVSGNGLDTDLSVIWARTYYLLYENGAQRDLNSIPIAAHTISNGLYIGAYDTGEDGFNGIIRHIRIDEYPDAAAQAAISGLWSDADQRYWTRLCSGRDFIVDSPSHSIKGGVHKSSFTLREVRSSETAIDGEK